MISANELRLGNLIGFEYGDNGTISIIHEDYVCIKESPSNAYGYNNINPIPLTEDILLKTPFKKQDILKKVYCKNVWLFNRIRINEHSDGGIFYYNGIVDKQIKYVHQLQNLYFVLCGEELTINL